MAAAVVAVGAGDDAGVRASRVRRVCDAGGAKDQASALFDKIAAAFKLQLTAALEHLPEDAQAGVIV